MWGTGVASGTRVTSATNVIVMPLTADGVLFQLRLISFRAYWSALFKTLGPLGLSCSRCRIVRTATTEVSRQRAVQYLNVRPCCVENCRER